MPPQRDECEKSAGRPEFRSRSLCRKRPDHSQPSGCRCTTPVGASRWWGHRLPSARR